MAVVRTTLILATLAAAAAPAAAQPPTQFEIDNLRAQQEAAQRREVDLTNQLAAAEARLRADSAVASMQLQQRLPPTVPVFPYPEAASATASATMSAATAVKYPQISNADLSASNQRVQAAAQNRR